MELISRGLSSVRGAVLQLALRLTIYLLSTDYPVGHLFEANPGHKLFGSAVETELLRIRSRLPPPQDLTHPNEGSAPLYAGATIRTDMNMPFGNMPAAAQPLPRSKTMRNVRRRGSRVQRKRSAAGTVQQVQRSQDARKNYEHYLALARAEALTGDRIAAENYLQHAEHYLRSMHQNAH